MKKSPKPHIVLNSYLSTKRVLVLAYSMGLFSANRLILASGLMIGAGEGDGVVISSFFVANLGRLKLI